MELLEGSEHATEVLADKLLDEGLAGEAEFDIALGADLVDEAGASLESELLRENEGVVAIEKKGVDLQNCVSIIINGEMKHRGDGLLGISLEAY